MLNQTYASNVRGCQATEKKPDTTTVAGSGTKDMSQWKLLALDGQLIVLISMVFKLFSDNWQIINTEIAVWTLGDTIWRHEKLSNHKSRWCLEFIK